MAMKESVESTVRNIRRNTRKKYGAEEKIRIVLEGMKGESTIAELWIRKFRSLGSHERIKESKQYISYLSSYGLCRGFSIRWHRHWKCLIGGTG